MIIAATLLSGAAERLRLPQVVLFLAMGLALGPHGLGLIDLGLGAPVFQAIATLGLVLVLFTDAVSVDPDELRTHRRLALLLLGPGALATAAVVGLTGWALLGLAPASAAILGAALASTDPVLLRGLLKRSDVPRAARHALGIESGLNDLVLLPVVLVGIAILTPRWAAGEESAWVPRALELFVLGPGAGALVGAAGVRMLVVVRRRLGMRRDYESLYAIGLALVAYAAAEALGGSGFLAAAAAGITIAITDAELCDCFLDFGQAAAEVFLLFTFVALGSSLIWTGLEVVTWRTLAFAAVALGARSAVLAVALVPLHLDRPSRQLIVWSGPRGLSTLLLVLLPVFAGTPGGAQLFAVAACVVLLSVILHGGAMALLPGAAGEAGPPASAHRSAERITIAELRALLAGPDPVRVVDVRTERTYRRSPTQAAGAIRLPPEAPAERAAELALPRNDWLVAYCT